VEHDGEKGMPSVRKFTEELEEIALHLHGKLISGFSRTKVIGPNRAP